MDEADEPESLVDLFNADLLTGEDLAEIDFPSVEVDSAAGGYDDDVVVEGVVDVLEPFNHMLRKRHGTDQTS